MVGFLLGGLFGILDTYLEYYSWTRSIDCYSLAKTLVIKWEVSFADSDMEIKSSLISSEILALVVYRNAQFCIALFQELRNA